MNMNANHMVWNADAVNAFEDAVRAARAESKSEFVFGDRVFTMEYAHTMLVLLQGEFWSKSARAKTLTLNMTDAPIKPMRRFEVRKNKAGKFYWRTVSIDNGEIINMAEAMADERGAIEAAIREAGLLREGLALFKPHTEED